MILIKKIVQHTVQEFYDQGVSEVSEIKRDFDERDWLFWKLYIFVENFKKSRVQKQMA